MPSSITSTALSEFAVSVFSNDDDLGRAAAEKSAEIIQAAIAQRGSARLLLATGNSQLRLMHHLVQMRLDWSKVQSFHLDEYVGIRPDHPASFQHWIRTRYAEKVAHGGVDYLNGQAADPDAEAARYSRLLAAGPIDLAFVGFGENGHIAFNDPHVADFKDPLLVKRVALDAISRRQQVNEGHFPDMDQVPREAMSVTCTGLLRAKNWVCSVPELRKANAVRAALEGALSPRCPATLVKTHPRAFVFLDTHSASLLQHRPWLAAGVA